MPAEVGWMDVGSVPLKALASLGSGSAAYKFCVSGSEVRLMVDGYPRGRKA